MHVSANNGRNILVKILENTPYTGIHDEFPKEVKEEVLQEETQIVESEPIQSPIQTLAISSPKSSKEEEIPLPNFMLDFKDDPFAKYGNTSRYIAIRKP